MKPLEPAVSLARSHGLAVENPIVLRDLSNLLVHLQPSPVVARVATTTAAARGGGLEWLSREVDLAAFLVTRGAPVVAPAAELPPGPHLHEGWPITFWQADVSLVTLGRRPSGTTRTGPGAGRCSARNAAPPPRLAGAERPG
jgi:hypothetical protein